VESRCPEKPHDFGGAVTFPNTQLALIGNIMLLIAKPEGPSKMPIWAFKTPHLQWPPPRVGKHSNIAFRRPKRHLNTGILLLLSPHTPEYLRYQYLSQCLTTGMQDRRLWGRKPRASQKPQYQNISHQLLTKSEDFVAGNESENVRNATKDLKALSSEEDSPFIGCVVDIGSVWLLASGICFANSDDKARTRHSLVPSPCWPRPD
jgi:hypothetical protein